MVIDHIGVVVKSIEVAVERWVRLFGYRQQTMPILNTRQGVIVVFLEKDGSLPVKLIEPSDAGSSVYALAQRGGGLHHLCFRCESVDTEVARLQAQGVRIISPQQPGEAFANEMIAFVYAGDGLNIELIDTARRAGLLVG